MSEFQFFIIRYKISKCSGYEVSLEYKFKYVDVPFSKEKYSSAALRQRGAVSGS